MVEDVTLIVEINKSLDYNAQNTRNKRKKLIKTNICDENRER
jgi:hypothetical protein